MADDRFPVLPHIQETAHMRSMAEYKALYQRSLDDPQGFWGEQA